MFFVVPGPGGCDLQTGVFRTVVLRVLLCTADYAHQWRLVLLAFTICATRQILGDLFPFRCTGLEPCALYP